MKILSQVEGSTAMFVSNSCQKPQKVDNSSNQNNSINHLFISLLLQQYKRLVPSSI